MDYTTSDFAALTIPQLKAIATEYKLTFKAKIVKADLIALIEAERARLADVYKAERTEAAARVASDATLDSRIDVQPADARTHIDTMTHDTNPHMEFMPNRRERREAKRQGQKRPDGTVKRKAADHWHSGNSRSRGGARGTWSMVL